MTGKATISAAAQKAVDRIMELGEISDHPGFLSRSLLSKANLRAAQTLIEWMEELGMTTTHTRDGSIRGILPGTEPDATPLLIGSHFDTVIDAGRYDGPLGIVSALAALEILADKGLLLPFPVHVLGFSDEEGVRFHSSFLGSRSIVECLDSDTLGLTDKNGISLEDALEKEGWSEGGEEICYATHSTLGYIELHIEQGKFLEDIGEPAGAVSTIVGQSRYEFVLSGLADHAGTTPMDLRRDAMTGAAECILAGESIACQNPPTVITAGKVQAWPGSSNVIPGKVAFSIDLRHPEDEQRENLKRELLGHFETIAVQRHLELRWKMPLDCDATPCDADLTKYVLDAVEETTGSRRILLSGAGHDGVAMAKIAPIAMAFLRCRDGLSHHPDEYASPEDISVGIDILVKILQNLKLKNDA